MKKIFSVLIITLFASGVLSAQTRISAAQDLIKQIDHKQTYSDIYLDTVSIKKTTEINDYSMIGIHYGMGLSRVMWNPTQKQNILLMPYNVGVTFTRHGKMFGYMPYFGFQVGLLYTQEGYQFKYNEERKYVYKVEGAEKAVMDVIEMPLLAHMHFDFWNMKVLANIGCYAGYRLSIQRFSGETGYVSPELEFSFKETDRRMDYGIKGGLGFGFIFDPFELHIQAMYKHSLSSLYDPDYYSKYYYRYAYPSNIILTAGLHYQLTKRTGKTKADLKKQAREMIYGNTIGKSW